MIEIIIVFGLKILDNVFATLKTIYLQKDKYFLASLMNAFATLVYINIISKIVQDNTLMINVALCLATFLGTYLPAQMLKWRAKDELWEFCIVSDTLENGKSLANILRENNIAIQTTLVYNKHDVKVLEIKAYIPDREKSKFVKTQIPNEFDINVKIPDRIKENLF